MTNRDIPADIRRMARQEANFGCVACGCPIIDYHHIEPFYKVKKHNIENIVALCPTCHRKANENGAWTKEYVIGLKKNPYNLEKTKDKFATQSDKFIVKLGWMEFHTLGKLIALKEQVVLSCIKREDGIIVVSGIFHDIHGNLIATIEENEWNVMTDKVWDIEYISGSRLTVRQGKRNIVLKMTITNTSLEIQQCFFIKDKLKLKLFGSKNNPTVKIEATNTFMKSKKEKVIFKNPGRGPALTLQ